MERNAFPIVKESSEENLFLSRNAFCPIFYNVPYTVPYTSPTRPLHVPYVPYKFPQRGEFSFFGIKQRPSVMAELARAIE